ncbi:hypothetical protein RFM23_14370 [Mesorhizobium abyssinicae]|uniref:Uncharacterized protein n=1 Tax=Mesorhizobium abyssinicae TaxID=1209958 RepID=A0ABU5ANJ9_9HYPH|nr:hypothetical protein [Mesorhizobium abyssinicae]MDX8538804.1 hypothetical protein [Mesorhizobium abyssinicae]
MAILYLKNPDDRQSRLSYKSAMTVQISQVVGAIILGVIGILAYRWFGLVAIVIVGGVGFPALMAVVYYQADLETRKGRGWNWLKDMGF